MFTVQNPGYFTYLRTFFSARQALAASDAQENQAPGKENKPVFLVTSSQLQLIVEKGMTRTANSLMCNMLFLLHKSTHE